jgi:hypothetical protein
LGRPANRLAVSRKAVSSADLGVAVARQNPAIGICEVDRTVRKIVSYEGEPLYVRIAIPRLGVNLRVMQTEVLPVPPVRQEPLGQDHRGQRPGLRGNTLAWPSALSKLR